MKEEVMNIRVTDQMKREIERRAAARGEAQAVIVREALSAYLFQDSGAKLNLPAAEATTYVKTPKRKRKPSKTDDNHQLP